MQTFARQRRPLSAEPLGDMATVYVELLDEGTICWRSVMATWVAWNHFRLSGPVPKTEVWAFQPGEVVACRPKLFQDRRVGLVAYKRVA